MPFIVNDIKQKSAIKVNEEGAEAAAVTVSGLTTSAGNPVINIVFDRPFVYVICEVSTGTVLFTGAYLKAQ